MPRRGEPPSHAHSLPPREFAPEDSALGVHSLPEGVHSSPTPASPRVGETPAGVVKASSRTVTFLTIRRAISVTSWVFVSSVAKAVDGGPSWVCINHNKTDLRRDLMKSEGEKLPAISSFGWHTREHTHVKTPINMLSLKKALLETSTSGPQRTCSAENRAPVRDLIGGGVHSRCENSHVPSQLTRV